MLHFAIFGGKGLGFALLSACFIRKSPAMCSFCNRLLIHQSDKSWRAFPKMGGVYPLENPIFPPRQKTALWELSKKELTV